uniref:EF-hand domain-containing protein n=1 Tax=Trypanosoma vivax (strain Y486) TaxID=1055687 RepID=G0UBC6_TRYVY|nr:conserved hypothetical protein [Trypanosoma vivax Y486]
MFFCTTATWRRMHCALYGTCLSHTVKPCCRLAFARRFFWNPFSTSDADGKRLHMEKSESAVEQHEGIVLKAQRDAMLHNERLLDACLELLSLCRPVEDARGKPAPSGGSLDMETVNIVTAVVGVTLHDTHKTPAEQFDLIYAALCMPSVANNIELKRCLMVVLEALLPEALFRVFEGTNLSVVGPDGKRQREVLSLFVHTLLGTVEVPDGVEREELVLTYLDDVRNAFPALRGSQAFTELERNATRIAMRAKLYVLLSQLCAEFDREGTGKVNLCELQETAERVLGKEQAVLLLDGARPDAEGKIRYTQLTALLTRPPPRRQ